MLYLRRIDTQAVLLFELTHLDEEVNEGVQHYTVHARLLLSVESRPRDREREIEGELVSEIDKDSRTSIRSNVRSALMITVCQRV